MSETVLEGASVRVRRATTDDVDFLVGLYSHDQVEPFLAPVHAGAPDTVRADVERSLQEPDAFGVFVIEQEARSVGTVRFERTNARSRIARLGALAIHPGARGRKLADDASDLLKRHLPYHESDHVLNIAFNTLTGGRRIEHLELRRNDEVYLDAVYEDTPRTSFHLGPEFVVTSSLTKVYGVSGLRCGCILARPDLARKMHRLNDLYSATPVHPGELLSVAADAWSAPEVGFLAGVATRPVARGKGLSRQVCGFVTAELLKRHRRAALLRAPRRTRPPRYGRLPTRDRRSDCETDPTLQCNGSDRR